MVKRHSLGLPMVASACVAGLLAASALAAATQPTLYIHANIHTMDAARPRAEAMLVTNGHIVAIGSANDVRIAADAITPGPQPRTGPNAPREVDLRGRTVLPGLVDCHGHMSGLGSLHLGIVDLARTRSYDEVIDRVAARAKSSPKGAWVVGRGWDHESWPEKALPTHELLSRACPDNPVVLSRVDGHAMLANAAAMSVAGITAETASPAGGEILHDKSGAPTGVFVDNAMDVVASHVPRSVRPDPESALLKAQELCLSAGLTGVHDAGVGPMELEVYQRLEAEGRLKLRVYAMVSAAYAPDWFEKHGLKKGDGQVNGRDERLTIRAAKMYIDGALGSRGAWLLEPYADRSAADDGTPYTGLAVRQPADVEALAADGLKRGYQVCTHAIGDRGNREVLDAYVKAIRAVARLRYAGEANIAGPVQPPPFASVVHGVALAARFRVEHAQLLSPEDIPRFAGWHIIASMQATHCTTDMRWIDARVGPERAKGAYAWASLLASGAVVAGGSDFPVESHNPFLGLYAAITRQNDRGEPAGGWMPQERMTREEALRSYTTAAVYAGLAETQRGELRAGMQADFIVIDRDVMTIEPREILGTKVLMTVVGGEVAWEAK